MTESQRNALHVWFRLVAEALNDAGSDVAVVMSAKTLKVPWTKESVKELLYRPTMKVMEGKTSTEELDTTEPSVLCDAISLALVSHDLLDRIIPFPHEEEKDHSPRD